MTKLDLKKQLRALYDCPAEPVTVDVPPMRFLMVDGEGGPDAAAYSEAIEALYGMSYTLKFMIKKEGGPDYGVLPLEGLWWADDMSSFLRGEREAWKWTAMIMQPDPVTEALVGRAGAELKRKKDPPALPRVRFEEFREGLCAQVMHVGPYSAEGPTIEKLHRFIEERGYALRGRHHEIYLGDPRRADPAKLRTIIRQPMEEN